MDEPFSALDVQTRQLMENEVLALWAAKKKAVLFITHDLDEAIHLSDRILVLGVNPGGVREVIENPVPRPRSPSQSLSPEFLALRSRLDALIHSPDSEESDDDGEDKLPMARLTMADDNVE